MSGHEELDFSFVVQDLTAPAGHEFITEGGRIKTSAKADRCIHGKGLGVDKSDLRTPVYCGACDFELILLERRPSERP